MNNDVKTAEPEVMIPEAESGNLPAIAEGPQVVHDYNREAERRGIQISERVIVRMSEQVDLLFAAIAEAQSDKDYGNVTKSQLARIASRKEGGANYSYTYETLSDVIDATRPFLAKVGVTVLQFPFPGQTSVTIRTMLAHKSGQWLYNDLSARIPMPDPQAVGSGISYLRRYAMKSILNVAATDEDDDGETASRPATPQPQSAPRPAQRKSQRAEPEAATPVRPAQAAAIPASTGKIKTLEEKSGGMLITLETGFKCATRNAEMMNALRDHKELDRVVELRTHASPDPAKYAPILDEISIQQAAE